MEVQTEKIIEMTSARVQNGKNEKSFRSHEIEKIYEKFVAYLLWLCYNNIRTRLVGGELSPICYRGTSIIKELEPTQPTILSQKQKGHRS